MQTATQARALAHYSALASQATCWASQAADAEAARADASDADVLALASVADDAADEFLLADGELLLHIADDTPRGHKLRSPAEAWGGAQIRDGLTCEEIIAACIWAPPGAALGHAMYVLRERLRNIVHTDYAEAAEIVARRILAAECGA